MGKLLYSATMSLDGFIAGAGGDMSWMSDLPTHVEVDVDALMAQIGALLIGNRTWSGDDPNKNTDEEGAFGGRWQGPSVVLTHEPPPGGDTEDTTFVSDLAEAVAAARAAAGDRYVNVLGANVAKQCLEAGELDEVLVFVAPILLGDGVRLFDHPGGTKVLLEPLIPGRVGSLQHWYRVRR